jgi:hypothetical protein
MTRLYLKSGFPPEGKNLIDGTETISPPTASGALRVALGDGRH